MSRKDAALVPDAALMARPKTALDPKLRSLGVAGHFGHVVE